MLRLILTASLGAVMAQASAVNGGGKLPDTPCQVITAADVAGILSGPVTSKPVGARGTCMYQTRTMANVTISAAQGNDAKGAWMLATTYGGTTTALANVGDQALFSPNGTTLIARRGDRSCRVDVVGYDNSAAQDSITKDRGEALARKLGALCTKLFAANTGR